MHRFARAVAAISVAGLLALAAAVPTAATETTIRPFSGSLVGGGTVVPDAGCPIGLRTVTWGRGQVTHLGLTTMVSSHCTPDWGAPIVGGVQTFVAANGDTLELTYTATVEPFEPVEGAVMTGPGATTITGGTGRFADATGEFVVTMRGILHFTTPMELSWSWSGAISY